jgi:hypothetical protein
MNVNPEFDDNYTNIDDCNVYDCDGKYLGKADVFVPAIPPKKIELNLEFDVSKFKELFED